MFAHAMPQEATPNPSDGPTDRVTDAGATESHRQYAMWIHIGSLIAALAAMASSGIGFFLPILTALIMWLVRKQDAPFIDDHGREALNFQISLVILSIVLGLAGVLTCGIGWVLFIPLLVLSVVGPVMGALAANRGEYFRYPACVRFIKD